MNFLSTGEKIKRARIYKGVTLKELCKSDISISKMSCIENDKVKADEWILEMVAERLELNIEYLLHNDIMELEASIKSYEEKNLTEKDFEDIKERLDYCLAKDYNELSFKFIHILFEAYTRRKKIEEIKNIINIYNEIQDLVKDGKQTYYEDLAFYFLSRRNFSDAATYFSMSKSELKLKGLEEYSEEYAKNNIWLSFSYYSMDEYLKAKETLKDLIDLNLNLSENSLTIISGLLAAIKMKLKEDYNKDLDTYLNFNGEFDLYYNSIALLIADNYFEEGRTADAIELLDKTKESVREVESFSYIQILLGIINRLITYNSIEKAKEYCEEALEISIKLDNHFFIERSYLYKAKIHRLQKSLIQWEMNMNLATDMLIRFASIEEKKERYMEMAEMYHVIGEIRETIKYLTLAMSLEKSEDI
ncbi:helix-turn-helix domain-containing protein [Clostridium sp.]|uniref:helix-turn-helix domain-containing protein n=1 Tax=Clostridium sp. TaxID=1506 RepID=UPI003992B4E5